MQLGFGCQTTPLRIRGHGCGFVGDIVVVVVSANVSFGNFIRRDVGTLASDSTNKLKSHLFQSFLAIWFHFLVLPGLPLIVDPATKFEASGGILVRDWDGSMSIVSFEILEYL